MFQLSEEQLLMTSDDNSIKLTTHRIIQDDGKTRKQILLEDFLSYQHKTAHIGNYSTLVVIFSITTIGLIIQRISDYTHAKEYAATFETFGSFLSKSVLFISSLILLTISFFFYLGSRRHLVSINGKYDNIEFRITNPGNRSIVKLLERLSIESQKRKQEIGAQNPN